MRTRRCTRCIMDTTDKDIVFDEHGFCNHCRRYFEEAKRVVVKGLEGKRKLEAIVQKIKNNRQNKQYDCLLGISGGADSSYAAYVAHKMGLSVLLVHFDNGWDSLVAKRNIDSIAKKTGFDLVIHTVDKNEVVDLQLAYLKASVVNCEVPTDLGIRATIYRVANEKKFNYLLTGNNWVTEGILPKSWVYDNRDLRNLKNIHRKFGTLKLKTFPTLSLPQWLYYRVFKGLRFIPLLNYVDYNKKQAKKLLQQEFGWKDYGGKHHESTWTKFYQAYILPTKFNIDKRKAHLSTLICSSQITREQALKELQKPLYEKDELERDKKYVLNELGLSEKDFEDIMALPIKKHQEYGTNERIFSLLRLGSSIIKSVKYAI